MKTSKKARRNYKQIIDILRDMLENSLEVNDVCEKYNIASRNTVYLWKRRYRKEIQDLIKDLNAEPDELEEYSDIMAGERIKDIRLMLGLQQKEMAQLLEVTIPTYSSYETGRNSMNLKILQKINRVLGINPNYILFNCESMFSSKDLKHLCEIVDKINSINKHIFNFKKSE